MRHKNFVLLIICTIIRLCCLLSRDSFFVADEYWQSLEVAHKLVFGYGYLTWEWIYGIRSYIYVSWIAVVYKVLKVFRLDNVQNLVWLPCIIQGVFTAFSDTYFIAWVHKVSMCQRQAYWSVWCYMTNVLIAYCATRTLTNTLETNLTCIALYYYPWNAHEVGRVKYFWFVCLACVIRPTAAIQWMPLCFYALSECKNPLKVFIMRYVPVGLIVLSLATLIDSFFYGEWVFTWWNFFIFNVIYNIGAHYSVHSLYWYFVIGLPVVLGPCIIPFYITIASNIKPSRSYDSVYDKLVSTIWFSLLFYSFIPHKEFRFILPLVPLMIFISSYKMRKWAVLLNKYYTYLVTFTILTISVHVFYYLSQYHQVATVRVMQYFSDPSNNLLFLMPCHLTPLYSHLHVNITTRFLHCDPNLTNAVGYVEESTKFYNNPMAWLDNEYPMSTKTELPTHVICFDLLEPPDRKSVV